MTRFFITLIALSGLLPHGLFAQNGKKPISTAKIPSGWLTHSAQNCSVAYPSDWTLDASGTNGAAFFILSPLTSEEDPFSENVNLIIQDLNGQNVTMDAFVIQSEKEVKTMLSNGEILLSKRMTGNHGEYHRIIFTGDQEGVNLQFEQFYIMRNGKVYVVTLTCLKDQFENYRETGETILKSLRFK